MDLTQTVVSTVTGVVQVALIGLLGLLFAWAKGNTKSERLKTALEVLEKAAATTVGELQQTTVEALKAAHEDGKLTKDEIKKLQRDALALVKQRMGAAAQDTITAAGLDLEDRIKAEVEAFVLSWKNSAKTE